MKIALVTTTINVPHVLKLYRACDEDVRFFVAIDQKTPEAAVNLCQYDIPNTQVCFIQDQEQWACSELIGWNTIGRRSIAILEALKWGAEIIVTIDDDNAPLSLDYFDRFEMVLGAPFSGLSATGAEWFDPGCLLHPYARHRGFPYLEESAPSFGTIVGAKTGVAAGLCLGDPDISAIDRISQRPIVQNVSQIGANGVVVEPATGRWTVFNSQNTAFLRELAPAFLMVPQFRRYDDIFASLIAQRVMRETGHVVHFGHPFVWQQRNQHNLLNDLEAETWGMRHVVAFADWLDQLQLSTNGSVLDNVRRIYDRMEPPSLSWMSAGVSELGQAWCDDVEKVL